MRILPFGVDLSLERLPDIDADHIFWQVRQDDDGQPDLASIDLLEANPLWERLPAVAEGHVHGHQPTEHVAEGRGRRTPLRARHGLDHPNPPVTRRRR